MEYTFTFEQILFFCGAIASIGAAFNWIAKGLAVIKKPNAEQNKRLDAIEAKLKKHDLMLDKDLQRIAAMEKENHLSMQALLALLQHGIDGNNVEPMKAVQKDIQDYLIKK